MSHSSDNHSLYTLPRGYLKLQRFKATTKHLYNSKK